jgi:hypothetical protein
VNERIPEDYGGETLSVISLFSAKQYVDAFAEVKPTSRELEILRVHRNAPDCTVTARHLARMLGFANWNAANLCYGRFAGRLCRALSVRPETNLSVLVEFFKTPGFEYELCLRPAVIEALDSLGVRSERFAVVQEEFGLLEPLTEGTSYSVQVNAFERNPVARERCITHYGTACAACGFDFAEVYGSAAKAYIQVHHVIPIASIGIEYVIDPIKDLIPVCANCHAVMHLRTPPYNVNELRLMLSAASVQRTNLDK